MKGLFVFLLLPLCSFASFYKDIVSTSIFAEELAFVYVKNIYGEDAAINQKPYKIVEQKNSWIVKGREEKDRAGGSFFIEIAKKMVR
ncbi:NTF2 fold immunity protein [Buttiauxella ferragutiae ATCC 51602]|uniref:NTF2 fold immunity protein n=1 Tax=Buttiauxella ferragutiae ATCC 51602 TaxID=1354252 RepID=A0ABX2W554_9ENTR|nr:NTF2 fold immunity protein [Buttiauxella ferragutiae]OAT25871.1 NTF2 fold immunity protein [Buttiauxella ferragutiae ATCC 51602]